MLTILFRGDGPRALVALPLPRLVCILDDGREFLRLSTLADVRDFLEHIPKQRRQFSTWQHVEAELEKAAADVDTAQLSIALRMMFQLESVEYQMKEAGN